MERTMDNEQWTKNFGIIEDWNNGILEKTKKKKLFLSYYSAIPSFYDDMGLVHRSWFSVHCQPGED